jgi:hypothetical protein
MDDEHGGSGKVDPFTGDVVPGNVKINAQDGAHVTINIKVVNFDINRLREILADLKIDGILNATFALILGGIFQ